MEIFILLVCNLRYKGLNVSIKFYVSSIILNMFADIQNFLKVGAICAALMTVVVRSEASSYYVDYSSGSDSNAGTSTGAAWQHCPGDPAATGNSASTTPSGGDTVFFKGGVTYYLTVPGINAQPGSPGSPVTYDGNSAGSWGSGRAIVTCATNSSLNGFYNNSGGGGHDITIKNFDIGKLGGGNYFPADTGSAVPDAPANGIWFTDAHRIIIDGCHLHEIDYWENTKPADIYNINGFGIVLQNNLGDILITNCEFTKVSKAVELGATVNATNIAVANCFFHDYIVWGIDFPANANNCLRDQVYFHDCLYSNCDWAYDPVNWTGYINPHCDGIFDRTDTGITNWQDGNFICIYNNTVFNTHGEITGGTAWLYAELGPTVQVYNNVFNGVKSSNGHIDYWCNYTYPPFRPMASNTVSHIVNNTFFGNYVNNLYIHGQNGPSKDQFTWRTNNLLVVENNIFYDTQVGNGANCVMALALTNSPDPTKAIIFDYNLYGTFNTANLLVNVNNFWPAGYLGLQYPSAAPPNNYDGLRSYGWETNGLKTDPLFVSLSSSDLHLQTTSPAIGAGANLTSLGLPGLNEDKDGNPRPPIGPWTIGAYVSIDSALLPFVSLVATPNSIVKGQSVTLTWMSLNATNLSLTGIGPVATDGSTTVAPLKNGATYVMTAMGTNGITTATVSVTVKPPPPIQFPPQ